MSFQQPDSRPIDGEGKYRTFEPYVYEWTDGARFRITIPEGFEYDGASIPRILWSLAGLTPDGPIRAAALVHDFLYRYGGRVPWGALQVRHPDWPADHKWVTSAMEFTRAQADALFRKIMLEAGISSYRAWLAWSGVRVGGWASWGAKHPAAAPAEA